MSKIVGWSPLAMSYVQNSKWGCKYRSSFGL